MATMPREKARVIVVDDSPEFRDAIREFLGRRYDVVMLSDGEDFLEELAEVKPDLVVMDLRLPGPDGTVLCRQMRASRYFDKVPVLFLSGVVDDADFAKLVEAGGTACMTKPIDPGELASKIDELIRNSG